MNTAVCKQNLLDVYKLEINPDCSLCVREWLDRALSVLDGDLCTAQKNGLIRTYATYRISSVSTGVFEINVDVNCGEDVGILSIHMEIDAQIDINRHKVVSLYGNSCTFKLNHKDPVSGKETFYRDYAQNQVEFKDSGVKVIARFIDDPKWVSGLSKFVFRSSVTG